MSKTGFDLNPNNHIHQSQNEENQFIIYNTNFSF